MNLGMNLSMSLSHTLHGRGAPDCSHLAGLGLPGGALPGEALPGEVFPGVGLPQERLARMAARRTFVDMKLRFSAAVAGITDWRGEWLREQVRLAEEPEDLWLLRGAVFSALQDGPDRGTARRLELHQVLERVFPDSGALLPVLSRA